MSELAGAGPGAEMENSTQGVPQPSTAEFKFSCNTWNLKKIPQ